MVGHATDLNELSVLVAENAPDVFVKSLLPVDGDEVSPILGSIHDVEL